jgi:hypothetical protein
MKKSIFFSLALLCLWGCRKGPSPELPAEYTITAKDNARPVACMAPPPPPAKEQSSALMEFSGEQPEMIVCHARISLRVDGYTQARSAVGKLLQAYHAFVTLENEEHTTDGLHNTMRIRLAHSEFEEMMKELTRIPSRIQTKVITKEDVTAEFVDANLRLKSKRAVEAQYLALLKQARTVEDMLGIEDKLRVIQEEIEAKEGEIKFMSDRVAYSTIDLELIQNTETTAPAKPGFFSLTGASFRSGWENLQTSAIAFVGAWPIWICVMGAGLWIYRFIVRTRNNKI